MTLPHDNRAAIERLSPRLINQIAAGEVVTRPAAAVKELIENSLDAGARRIEIIVEENARSFTIRDDGCGMDEANLRLSVERYCTSKIRELEDLERLSTRGFRGEALAAISAVSRIEVTTRTADSLEGLRLRMSGGDKPRVTPTGANPGTTIIVRDLFFNTPARLKFLKNPVAEWGHILQAIVRQALTRADVAFAVRWKGRPYLDLPADQPLIQRLAQVLPGEAGQDLLEVEHALHEARVQGAVSGPRTTRRDRRHQYFFVNGRPIAFRPLAFAMEEAYRGLIMTQRYPMAALLIEIPGELVDVNVHPTKEEVRFRNEQLITGSVHRAVSEALRAANLVPTLQMPPGHQAAPAPKLPEAKPNPTTEQSRQAQPAPLASSPPSASNLFSGQSVQTNSRPYPKPQPNQIEFAPGFGLSKHADPSPPASPASAAFPSGAQADPTAREEAGLLARLRRLDPPPRALAQVGLTYILAEAGEVGMLVIDQHAAHEKVMYLEFMRQAEDRQSRIEIQSLLVPYTLEVGREDVAQLESLIEPLQASGFDIEPFGGNTFVVQSVPVVFESLNLEAFIRDLIDDVGQGDLDREIRRLRERICARASCRAAVKSGDPLSLPEMQRLVDQLLETEELMRCPHGRPTTLLMTRDQLDRQFGRLG